jgi:hypothetical protein
MGFADRLIYTTPAGDAPLVVDKEHLPGVSCPSCGGTDVRRYPIAYYTGPRIVEKCQACFTVVSLRRPTVEDAWPPFRPATYDWDASPAERASVPDASPQG